MRLSRIRNILPILFAGLAGITLLCASIQTADARPRPHASRFSANKQFGLGIMFGVPSGLSGKYYLGADTALDFGVGVIERWRSRDGLHLHMDFLWHPAVLVNARPFVMPVYFGVGGRVFDYVDDNNNDDLALGLRIPGGIAFDFNNVPIDIFLELVFVFDFVDNNGRGADLNGAVGLRYYF